MYPKVLRVSLRVAGGKRKQIQVFPPEILEENQKLLTEVTVVVEAFLSERIDIDRVRKIIRRICEE